jgi:hypothetical protein
VSDTLPKSGWKDVLVIKNAVDSQDAEFEALKYDVIRGWLDAINVESNVATKYCSSVHVKISQKRVLLTPPM